jgi:quinol monooxygenase YgiN
MVATRAKPSCLSCQLSTEMGEQTGLCYVEEWKNEEALRRQLQSPSFSQLAELLERATEPPRVEFMLPSGIRGLDYAEEVRAEGLLGGSK